MKEGIFVCLCILGGWGWESSLLPFCKSGYTPLIQCIQWMGQNINECCYLVTCSLPQVDCRVMSCKKGSYRIIFIFDWKLLGRFYFSSWLPLLFVISETDLALYFTSFQDAMLLLSLFSSIVHFSAFHSYSNDEK